MNPYTFVPLAGPPLRERVAGHDRFDGHSGELRCILTVQTPLFLFDPRRAHPAEPPAGPGHEVADFPTDDQGRPLVWGTRLRGALRSVTEAASHSCLSVFDGHYERWTVDYRSRLPIAYRHCEPGDHLCPACRLFGTVGSSFSGFAGAVYISDAAGEPASATLTDRITVPAIQSPKPHHQSFYLTADGDLAGRKFYYHHPNGPTATIERSRFTRTVQPVATGSRFFFVLSYRNLSDADLQLLLFALLLEPGLGHKLGMGKPTGMGSVTISLQSARNTAARDIALGRLAPELTGESLQQWTDDLLAPIRATNEPHLMALRAVLALDPGRPVAYPSADWFRGHPTASLSEVPDATPALPVPRHAPERSAMAPTVGRPSRGAPPVERPSDRRRPVPSRDQDRQPSFGRPDAGDRPQRGPQRPPSRPAPEREAPFRPSPVESPPPEPVEEPVVESRPATLEDLVRRFSRGNERPERTDPAETKESVRARDEQRRLMEQLRRRRE
jgi:CRISPR/Cas system CSM-associated protein Csm3 (group 7 of RAMP superfamily)